MAGYSECERNDSLSLAAIQQLNRSTTTERAAFLFRVPSQSGLKTGPEIDEKNELSTSTSRSFARCAAIPAQWRVRERHAIPPRKTEAPAAPTFPALVSPANHPSAQDFWDASFFQDFWDASLFGGDASFFEDLARMLVVVRLHES